MSAMAVHFASDKKAWETPPDFFNRLDQEFRFTLDVCATRDNAKCERFFSPEDDGLAQRWEGICWMNPPYGHEILQWIQKAYRESRRSDCTVVALLPSRTDTRWFHDYVMRAEELRLVRGRLRFLGAGNSAPFPSALAIFRSGSEGPPRLTTMTARGSGIDGIA